MKRAADGDQGVIAQAETEILKNAAIEAGAHLTAQAHERNPESESPVVITHTEKSKVPEAPAGNWLLDWEVQQEEQNDRRREMSDHETDK